MHMLHLICCLKVSNCQPRQLQWLPALQCGWWSSSPEGHGYDW